MSSIRIHRHAAKYLGRLPKDDKTRIKSVLQGLESSPLTQSGIKHMVGEWAGYHRMRIGKFRIIFWYDEKEDIVYVDHIGPRGDVYK